MQAHPNDTVGASGEVQQNVVAQLQRHGHRNGCYRKIISTHLVGAVLGWCVGPEHIIFVNVNKLIWAQPYPIPFGYFCVSHNFGNGICPCSQTAASKMTGGGTPTRCVVMVKWITTA